MFRCVIVENEENHITHIEETLKSQFSEIRIVGIYTELKDAISNITHLKPDVVFLSIEFNEGSGFELLRLQKENDFKTIFMSKTDAHALIAYEFNPLHYLLKPIDSSGIQSALERLIGSQSIEKGKLEYLFNRKHSSRNSDELYLPIKNGLHKLKLNEIVCCTASGSGVTFSLVDQEDFSISKSLNWMERYLKHYSFFRTHDSYLVNILHIKRITHVREGAELILEGNRKAEVSKRKKATFLQLIAQRNVLSTIPNPVID